MADANKPNDPAASALQGQGRDPEDEGLTAGDRTNAVRSREGTVTVREDTATLREEAANSREEAASSREDAARLREETSTLREEAVRAREEAAQARSELEGLMAQMREANERLIVGTVRAQTLTEDAEQANHLKDEFLATVSHELRTPLNAILGWARMLGSNQLPADRATHAIAAVERNASALAHIIDDLLDVSRIVAGTLQLAPEPVDLVAVAQSALDAVRPLAATRNVQITFTPGLEALEPVSGDAGRLQQVIWNLLANAIKFTPAGGTISVGIEQGESDLTVRISDTGAGIAPEFLPRLFERFSQADSSSTRRFGGLGLGLSICKSLVEMHGGAIWAASDGEGRGATVSVRLPLAQAGKLEHRVSTWGDLLDADMPPVEAVPSLTGARILIVDDDDEGRQMLVTVLQQYDAVVLSASSADDAFDQAQASWPDLIICDIGMPVVDGHQLLWRIRKHSNVPAIALTALAQPSDRRKALESGFAAHIAKPAPPALVVRTCADVLSARMIA
jgi:signal transduction histidine kinase